MEITKMLFPLDQVHAHLAGTFPDIHREKLSLSFNAHTGRTTIKVLPSNYQTEDGMTISEVVVLEHEAEGFDRITLEQAAAVNRYATVSALFAGTSDVITPRTVSKVGIFSTDQAAAERVYAPMIAMEAAAISWWTACICAGEFNVDPDLSPLTMIDDAAPYARDDFEKAAEIFNSRPIMATVGEDSLTFELPWDEGAVSSMYRDPGVLDTIRAELRANGMTDEEINLMGGRTSLVTIKTTERHPIFGEGLQCLLQLAVSVPEDASGEAAQALNLWELTKPDLPPMFGSWCAGNQGPAFVSFFPTSFCVPGLPTSLVYWTASRHAMAQAYLQQVYAR
jgi:hypothetical protein